MLRTMVAAAAVANSADQGVAAAEGMSAAAETRLAPVDTELRRCAAVGSDAQQLAPEVQHALDQATEMAANLTSISNAKVSGGPQTETDRAIAQGDGKENSSDIAASLLRRRADAKLQEMQQAAKQPRLM